MDIKTASVCDYLQSNHLGDATTQWIDSLKIHLLHPHATAIDAHDWILQNNRPCAIEKYVNLSIEEYQKGLGQPLQSEPSLIIDISVTSDVPINDVSLCWIVGDQIYYPNTHNQHYLDWIPNPQLGQLNPSYLGLIRLQPSIQPVNVTLHYKELYLPNDCAQQSHIFQMEPVHISNFHVVISQGQVQSCWRNPRMCPDPAELEVWHPPTSLGQSIHLIDLHSRQEIENNADEFIHI